MYVLFLYVCIYLIYSCCYDLVCVLFICCMYFDTFHKSVLYYKSFFLKCLNFVHSPVCKLS